MVVDASVAAKWFFAEEHAEGAARLLDDGRALLAPDLIYAEFGNVVWKRARRGEITGEEAAGLAADFVRLPLEVTESAELMEAAVALAIETGRTVYDCLYLALAIGQGCEMVTGDERLVNALGGGDKGKLVRWVGAG